MSSEPSRRVVAISEARLRERAKARRQGQASMEPAPDRIRPLQLREVLEQDFYCWVKLRRVQLGKCLDDFVSHTAFGLQQSDCCECNQGDGNRRRFAAR